MARILLFGYTGKLGTALTEALGAGHELVTANSRTLDVSDFDAVRALVRDAACDVIVNAVAVNGVRAADAAPEAAIRVNALFPRLLAQLVEESRAVLVHFSSETVFSGALGRPLAEEDAPDPINLYGLSKYLSEVLIREATARHYVFRLPVLFGPSARRGQFLERMIDLAAGGAKELRIADDVVTSPLYTLDAAEVIARMLAEAPPFGLYHLANEGRASLYDLVSESIRRLGLPASLKRASWRDFQQGDLHNTFTPLVSNRLPPLRPWQEALSAYIGKEH